MIFTRLRKMVRWEAMALMLLLAFPAGAAGLPRIDGRSGENEWASASVHELREGGKVFISPSERYLDLAIQGEEDGWVHVYIADGNVVRILHASAALGTAQYAKEGDAWNLVREFSWGVRDASMSQAAAAERRRHLENEGWVASTGRMGDPGFIEMRIDRHLLSESARIAVVFAASADAPHYWPATLRDDTLAEKLIFGTTPPELRFDPSEWASADDF